MALTIDTDTDTLVLDAAFSNNLQASNDVTEHPIEKGSNPSDHIRPRAEEVQISGIISDTPVPTADRTPLGRSSVSKRTRASDAIALLRRIRRDGTLCTLSDSRSTYVAMAMTSLQVPRDPKTGAAARFSATFKEFVTVSTQTVTVQKVQRVNTKKNLIKQVPVPVEDNRSLDAKLDDSIRSFIGSH